MWGVVIFKYLVEMLFVLVVLLGFIVFRVIYIFEFNKGLNLKSLDGDGFIGCGFGGGWFVNNVDVIVVKYWFSEFVIVVLLVIWLLFINSFLILVFLFFDGRIWWSVF